MIRIFGALCVVCGFGAWGAIGAVKLTWRAKNLAAIARSLGTLRSELCTRLTPLPELMQQLARDAEEPFAAMCRNLVLTLPQLGETRFSELWKHAAETSVKLQPDESAVLIGIGRSLGRYDADEQREMLLYAEQRFREFAERASSARDRDAKTRLAAGLSVGIILALVLL